MGDGVAFASASPVCPLSPLLLGGPRGRTSRQAGSKPQHNTSQAGTPHTARPRPHKTGNKHASCARAASKQAEERSTPPRFVGAALLSWPQSAQPPCLCRPCVHALRTCTAALCAVASSVAGSAARATSSSSGRAGRATGVIAGASRGGVSRRAAGTWRGWARCSRLVVCTALCGAGSMQVRSAAHTGDELLRDWGKWCTRVVAAVAELYGSMPGEKARGLALAAPTQITQRLGQWRWAGRGGLDRRLPASGWCVQSRHAHVHTRACTRWHATIHTVIQSSRSGRFRRCARRHAAHHIPSPGSHCW